MVFKLLLHKKYSYLLAYTLICIVVLLSPTNSFATLYEDAEDGDTQGNVPPNVRGWFTYDGTPAGSVISNVFDTDKQSRVIQFTAPGGTQNGFMLGDWYPTSAGTWNNTSEFNLNLCMRYSSAYVLYMRVYTANYISFTYNGNNYNTNQRYIYYTSANSDLGVHSNQSYIHHGLGSATVNGQWHSIHRDLQADLQEYEPTNSITSVTAFLIRGSGKVDDIQLTTTAIKPEINLKKTVEVIHDPLNGIINPKSIPGATHEYTLKAENFGLQSADNNSTILKDKVPVNTKICVADVGECRKPYLVGATNSSGMSIGSIKYVIGGSEVTNPPADIDGTNSTVTELIIEMNGEFPDMCSGNHSFEVKFRSTLK